MVGICSGQFSASNEMLTRVTQWPGNSWMCNHNS